MVFSPSVLWTKRTCGRQSRLCAHTMKGISKSFCPQQPCGAGAWLDQSLSVAHGVLGFGALWVGGSSCPKPEKKTGDGELWEDKGTTEGTETGAGGCFLNLACCHWQVSPELVGRPVPCNFSHSWDRSHTKQPDLPWCLSWSNQTPIKLSHHRE